MVAKRTTLSLDWTRPTRLLGRLCLSAIFLISGVGKLLSPAATVAEIRSAGLPFPELGFVLALGIELLCGGALPAGFKLRWTASILAAFTLFTALFFHSSFADPNQLTHFLKNVAITGGLLHVVVIGGDADR
jgi:putative oxidoreductase